MSQQPLTFGVYLLANDATHGIEQLRQLESAGFDTAWIADTLGDWQDPTRPWLDCWVALGAYAVASQRIELGMLISNLSWRDPVHVARFAMSVDRLTGGRFTLGLGCGPGDDQVMAGAPILTMPPKERVDRLAEGVGVIDRLLRGDETAFHGRFTDYDAAAMAPGSVQQPRPPLLIAGVGPRVVRLAAEHADTWNAYIDAETSFEDLANRVEVLDAHLGTIGRDPATLTRSLLILDGALDVWADDETLPRVVEQFTPLGFTDFVLFPPDTARRNRIDQVARDVIPQLRRSAP